MIYVAHTESKATPVRIGNSPRQDDRLTDPSAQLKSCMDLRPLAQSGSRSLVFGPAFVRKVPCSRRDCTANTIVANQVNLLWYGRALACLRTYPQWSLRAVAVQRHLQSLTPNDAIDCLPLFCNPVQ